MRVFSRYLKQGVQSNRFFFPERNITMSALTIGTVIVEAAETSGTLTQARAAVDEIDRALAKIDGGNYGICEKCGQPIPKARLKALPYAALCVQCKSGGLSRR